MHVMWEYGQCLPNPSFTLFPKLWTWSSAIWRNSPRKYGVAIGQYQEHWLHSPCHLTWQGLRSTQTDGNRDRTFQSYVVRVFQKNSSTKSLNLNEFDTHESELVDVTHFNINGFTIRLDFTQRKKATRECPTRVFLSLVRTILRRELPFSIVGGRLLPAGFGCSFFLQKWLSGFFFFFFKRAGFSSFSFNKAGFSGPFFFSLLCCWQRADCTTVF